MDKITSDIIERAAELLGKTDGTVFTVTPNQADVNVLQPGDQREKLSIMDQIRRSFHRYFKNIKELRRIEIKTSARNARNNAEFIKKLISLIGRAGDTAVPGGPKKQTGGTAVFLGNHIDLGGMNFSCLPLCGMDFQGMSLEGADFRGAELDGANFSCAELSEADFSRASLRSADFSGACLENTDFAEADLEGAKFMKAMVYGANFSGTVLEVNMSAEEGDGLAEILKQSFEAINQDVSEMTGTQKKSAPSKSDTGLAGVLKQCFDSINSEVSEMIEEQDLAASGYREERPGI